MSQRIVVLIPCFNEELTIAKVIQDFQHELPNALIYVYDNNSSDNSTSIALEHKAIVKKEFRQGKGSVMRSMFRDIDADIYILVDGDDTYPASSVHSLMAPIFNLEADMVIADRHTNGSYNKVNKRAMHSFGNNFVKNLINILFNANLNDIMSGFRVFNRKFIKNIAIISNGFEVETEITLQALDKQFLLKEIPITYKERPSGSISKLNTFSDGIKVLKTILWIFKDYKPLTFFSAVSFLFIFLGILIGLPVVIEFIQTSFVSKVPSAILAVGLIVIGTLSLFCGFILDTVVKHHREDYQIKFIRWIEKQ